MKLRFLVGTILVIVLFGGCASSAFKDAKKLNTVNGYDKFLKEYGDSEFASEAKVLKEKSLYELLTTMRGITYYDRYINEYPNGKYISEVKDLKEEYIFIHSDSHTYLLYYPKGKFVDDAKEKILNKKLEKYDLNKQMYVKYATNGLKVDELITIEDIFIDTDDDVYAKTDKGEISILDLGKERSNFLLTVNAPEDSTIKIDGRVIKDRNIWLKKASYTIEVIKRGYYPRQEDINIYDDKTINVELKKMPFLANGKIEWKEEKNTYSNVVEINGLLWENRKNLDKRLTYDEAEKYCESLDKSIDFQSSEFRLPTYNELEKLDESKLTFGLLKKDRYWARPHTRGLKWFYRPMYKRVDNTRGDSKLNAICVRDGKSINESSSIIEIADYIYNSKSKKLPNKFSLPPKPIKQTYYYPENLEKGEFETTTEFKRRVEKENERVKSLNEEIDENFKKRLSKWEKDVYRIENEQLQFIQKYKQEKNKYFLDALKEANYIKNGKPIIKDASYNADTQEFKIKLLSNRNFKDAQDYFVKINKVFNKNDGLHVLLDYNKEKFYEYMPIAKISNNNFQEKSGRWYDEFIGENVSVYKYFIHEGKKYYPFDNSNNKSRKFKLKSTKFEFVFDKKYYKNDIHILMYPQKAYSIQVPLISVENVKDFPTAINPKDEKTVFVPVKRKYAKKFKELLTDLEFNPTIIYNVVDNELIFDSIKEIQDPELFVEKTYYEDNYNSVAGLKSLLKKYPKSPYAYKAKNRIKKLKIELKNEYEKIDSINSAKAFLSKYYKSSYEKQAREKLAHYEKVLRDSQAKKEREEYERKMAPYWKKKRVGERVCQDREAPTVLFMKFGSGYQDCGTVEQVSGNRIQIKMEDNNKLIWDYYDNWK